MLHFLPAEIPKPQGLALDNDVTLGGVPVVWILIAFNYKSDMLLKNQPRFLTGQMRSETVRMR